MNRKSFIRNSLMSLAVAFLPKVLLPSKGEIEDETQPEWTNSFQYTSTYKIGLIFIDENGIASSVKSINQ